MAHRNAPQSRDFTVRFSKSHEKIHAAFVHALDVKRCTQEQAARGMGVHVDTVRNYVKKRTPVDPARVMAFPRLEAAFLEHLCVHDHDTDPEPMPQSKAKRGLR